MSYPARVVLFDPALSIAVLDVPALNVPALDFAGTFIPLVARRLRRLCT